MQPGCAPGPPPTPLPPSPARTTPGRSGGQLTSLGIDPRQARIIVVKAAVAYKAAYAPVGGTVIEVDTPGLTAINPARFEYKRIKRPMYPLDAD